MDGAPKRGAGVPGAGLSFGTHAHTQSFDMQPFFFFFFYHVRSPLTQKFIGRVPWRQVPWGKTTKPRPRSVARRRRQRQAPPAAIMPQPQPTTGRRQPSATATPTWRTMSPSRPCPRATRDDRAPRRPFRRRPAPAWTASWAASCPTAWWTRTFPISFVSSTFFSLECVQSWRLIMQHAISHSHIATPSCLGVSGGCIHHCTTQTSTRGGEH